MPTQDRYYGEAVRLSDPSNEFREVTASDDTDLEHGPPKALFVGLGGNVVVIGEDNADDEPVTFKNVPDGGLLPIRPRRVLDTGTTAGDIVALY